MRDAGYYALESLRLEKGYRAWGRELTPDNNPWEAGLGFAVKLDKGDFIGRDALLAAKDKPPARRLLVHRDGGRHADRLGRRIGPARRQAGRRSALGRLRPQLGGRGLGYVGEGRSGVDENWLAARFELDIAGEPFRCARVSDRLTIPTARA